MQSAWARTTGQAPNLLVLVDQFEEVFTYADAADAVDDESDAFVQLLLAARAAHEARIHVALTMRTDFLGQCVEFVDLPDAINRAQYLMPRLTRTQMERAIVAPAEVFGGKVEPTLVTELINATGQNSDQLPLIQHALSRMWPLALQRKPHAPCIDWDDERAVGGVQGALGHHAEALLAQALAALPPSRAQLPEALLRSITARRAGGQDVRQPRTLARSTRACGLVPDDWPMLAGIVATFSAIDACLLQHGSSLDPDSVIDLSHEALMRQWPRLAGWVADEARRGAEYRRWSERAGDHASGSGSLLDGADLARAIEWWNPDVKASGRDWQPSAAWAERYAACDDTESARLEFQRTVAFIADSRAARQRIDAERERAEAEARTLDLERQHARENERMLRRLKRLVGVSGVLLALALGAGLVALQQSRQAVRESARAAAVERASREARAEEQMRRAEAERQSALARTQQALAAREESERLRLLAEDAAKRATHFAALAAQREKQAVSALEEIKRQQAAAEIQRVRAEQEREHAEQQRARAESEATRADTEQQRFRTLLAQDVLNSLYDTGIYKDGIFGAQTSGELRKLQADAGLEQTGRLDDATWTCVEALNKVDMSTRKAALASTCGQSVEPPPAPVSRQEMLELQRLLNERGFNVPRDGQFGMLTRGADGVPGDGRLPQSGALDRGTRACIARVRAMPVNQKGDSLRSICAP